MYISFSSGFYLSLWFKRNHSIPDRFTDYNSYYYRTNQLVLVCKLISMILQPDRIYLSMDLQIFSLFPLVMDIYLHLASTDSYTEDQYHNTLYEITTRLRSFDQEISNHLQIICRHDPYCTNTMADTSMLLHPFVSTEPPVQSSSHSSSFDYSCAVSFLPVDSQLRPWGVFELFLLWFYELRV